MSASQSYPALSMVMHQGCVAVITIDIPGQSVNSLTPELGRALGDIFASVEGDQTVRAVVLSSGKSDNFIVGADINMLAELDTAEKARAVAEEGQAGCDRISQLRVPVVAAIHGNCLGGGLELALACHARIASDDAATKLGLPEVKLGLIPGSGGTQRLPRLIGAQAALDIILAGKSVRARKAERLGLVDEIVPQAILVQTAVALALRLAEEREAQGETQGPLERIAQTVRGALSRGKLGEDLQEIVLEDNPLGRKVLFDTARKKLLSNTRGNYPAPEKALEAIRIGLTDPKRGYQAEAEFFGELVVSPQARCLIGIFHASRALKKFTGVADESVTGREVQKVAMIGAGLMGSGIAYVSAAHADIAVRLIDRDAESTGRGLASVRGILDERVRRRQLTPRQREELMAKVSPATDFSGLGNAEVVIEAVFEDLSVKHDILRKVEEAGSSDIIFASNTSTIPIANIAAASAHPETVIGMHYFSPVHKMPLLEVIVTEKTAPWVTATCVELGKRQGKTVIVVRDGVGFYTSRVLGPYVNEALHILASGVPVEAIDKALLDFGFPVGPIKLLDEVGMDVAHKAGAVVREAFGHRIDAPPGMETLISDERFGRKNQRGFYNYRDKKKGVDTSVYGVLGIEPNQRMEAIDIARRCTLQMVNEAAHCFGDGILHSARDGDIGAIFGLGFPPFLGGPFRYVDSVGAATLVGWMQDYEAKLGRRFTPAPVLVEMAQTQRTFYNMNKGNGAGATMAPGSHT